jgi:hypothetical protein
VRAGQGLALVTSAGVAGWFGRANKANTAVLYPPDAYRFSAAPPRSILTRLPRRAGRSQAGVAQGRGGVLTARARRGRRMCPRIVPQLAMAVLFTSDGLEPISAGRPVLFWAGQLTPQEVAALPSLRPVKDPGNLSLLYETVDGWTQAARPPPRAVLAVCPTIPSPAVDSARGPRLPRAGPALKGSAAAADRSQ